jgi:hypothetical protein
MVLLLDVTRTNYWLFVERVCIPVTMIAFVFYVFPSRSADPEQFAYGATSLVDALLSYVYLTFLRKSPPFAPLVESSAETLAIVILVCSAVVCVAMLRNKSQAPADRLIVLNGGAMALCLAITWFAHVTIRIGYPLTRYGIYWPVMLSLGGVALADRFARLRVLRWTALALAALCIAQFLHEFEVSYYEEWRYDSGSKRIAAFILQTAGNGKQQIVCGGILVHSLTFYRNLIHADWVVNPEPKAEGALYVFVEEDFRPDLKLLYRDPVSHAVVMQ